jgi:hypothetical protein
MKELNKNISAILSILCLCFTFLLFFIVLFIDIEANHKDVVIYILGALTTLLSQVFSYYFGSSESSNSKNKTIENLSNKDL